MKMKKRAWQGLLCVFVTILAILLPQAVYATGGTDGTELQAAKAASLEIQLGPDWAGKTFQLRTDAGIYPGEIIVDMDGVLRLEIGGSDTYMLSSFPVSVQEQVPTTEESSEPVKREIIETQTNSITGIPAKHLIIFCGGMTIAVGTLIVLFIKHRKENNQNYSHEEDGE